MTVSYFSYFLGKFQLPLNQKRSKNVHINIIACLIKKETDKNENN